MKTKEQAQTGSEHLNSKCAGGVCRELFCDEKIKQAPSGRWFITMGHAGFNSPANNANGYKTEGIAKRRWYYYGFGKGAR